MSGRILTGLCAGLLVGWLLAVLLLSRSPVPATDFASGVAVVVLSGAGGVIGVMLALA